MIKGEHTFIAFGVVGRQVPSTPLPWENICNTCGAHIGWIIDPMGVLFALELCDDCQIKLEEKDNGEEDDDVDRETRH